MTDRQLLWPTRTRLRSRLKKFSRKNRWLWGVGPGEATDQDMLVPDLLPPSTPDFSSEVDLNLALDLHLMQSVNYDYDKWLYC